MSDEWNWPSGVFNLFKVVVLHPPIKYTKNIFHS